MAASERDCAFATARVRRAGTGTFERAVGAFLAALRRREYSGLQSHDSRSVFSRVEAAGPAGFSQAAGHHDAQVAAAKRTSHFAHRGFHGVCLSTGSRSDLDW